MSKVNIEIDVQAVIDAVQETFNGPDAGEIVDGLFERVVDKIQNNLDLGDIARELNLGDIAGEIDLLDLVEEIDLKELAEQIECNLELNLKELVDVAFDRACDKVDLAALTMKLNIGDIAGEIDISELAEHIELDELAERVADKVQHKLLKDWDVKETVETVVERMLSAQLADIRASIARLELERRTIRSAVEDLRSEVEALKALPAALRPLLKLMEALNS
jgi:hypothetical protein